MPRLTPAARAFPTLYADPHDRDLLGLAAREADQEWVLYVLTLGVAEVGRGCRARSAAGMVQQGFLLLAGRVALRSCLPSPSPPSHIP